MAAYLFRVEETPVRVPAPHPKKEQAPALGLVLFKSAQTSADDSHDQNGQNQNPAGIDLHSVTSFPSDFRGQTEGGSLICYRGVFFLGIYDVLQELVVSTSVDPDVILYILVFLTYVVDVVRGFVVGASASIFLLLFHKLWLRRKKRSVPASDAAS